MAGVFAVVPGAVFDGVVLRHLGSPAHEQRALAAGTAVVPRADRRVLAISGEDRLTWLDSLTSQAVARLQPGEGSELLVLDPNGRVEHAASLIDDGETAWLIVDVDDAAPLLAWLLRMRFRLRVAPRDAGDELLVIGGTRAAVGALTVAQPNGVALVWSDPWPDVAEGGWAYAADPSEDYDAAEALVTPDEYARVADDAARGDRAVAGVDAAEALRVAAHRPRWASEVDDRALPHELDWLRTAVHLTKGCYRGQETVAKVHNLGHPPRRVVALQLDGSGSRLPARGAAVRYGDDVVGAVTSAARHHEEGPIALAIIRRTVPVDAALSVVDDEGPIAAAQEVIVPPDAGAVAGVPRLPRLGRRRAVG